MQFEYVTKDIIWHSARSYGNIPRFLWLIKYIAKYFKSQMHEKLLTEWSSHFCFTA